MVKEAVQEDMGDGNMQCADHPHKNSTPGGICAFCLQEKLGKLVSSSFPPAIFPFSSTSSTPSFRSDYGGGTVVAAAAAAVTTTSSALALNPTASNNTRRSRLPFLLVQRRNKKKDGVMMNVSDAASIVYKRSKSTTTFRHGLRFVDDDADQEDYSPHRRGFWSLLYSSSKHSSTRKNDRSYNKNVGFASSSSSSSSSSAATAAASTIAAVNGGASRCREKKREDFVVIEENDHSPDQASFDRKVSRSRSVGCGSGSFSGDFFERISTGFGDCTLRRVESQREGKPKHAVHRNGGRNHHNSQDGVKERAKCGGIFSGFIVTSSSSSSSSSSYWLSSSAEDHHHHHNANGKTAAAVGHLLAHGRSRSWGWAFASPIRAFSSSKPSSNGKREAQNKNATPNLTAIPSLLAVRS